MKLEVSTLADRPDLRDERVSSGLPAFMSGDPSCWDLVSVHHLYPALQLVGQVAGQTVATAQAAPIAWTGVATDLPPQGWDDVVGAAVRGACGGHQQASAVSALIITVDSQHRGLGFSSGMLGAMKAAARRAGFRDLVAPVRPTLKHLEPHTSMREYAARQRDDGLPWDPWLRTHVRAGGVITGTCPASMTIGGSLAQWRAWTGLDFETGGAIDVWVHHRIP
ncbi:N-acetyltransferase [Leekyejoonella antrihumi]|uniref:N-acetyltransferase n=1 Tax=Leekyejoonella antrihumi TaxID=1660198 RepID=A0A563E9A0_9MICO|nr:N-acetyltransferase [Leekyejoonella antrihumi]TWP39067.1 N-acetyltransferase [Leekyejoonella antrihumi]